MRVIAGAFGGRRLEAPAGSRTRPTSDRVREALFMALEPLAGLRVVDLYAGSGALAIEALSRGAERADLVEQDRRVREVIERNLESLGMIDRTKVWALRLPQGLKHLSAPLAAADLVFADPPYGGGEARATLAALGVPGVLRPGARLVLERHGKDEVPERSGTLVRERERRYGETVVDLYRVSEQAAGAPEAGPRS